MSWRRQAYVRLLTLMLTNCVTEVSPERPPKLVMARLELLPSAAWSVRERNARLDNPARGLQDRNEVYSILTNLYGMPFAVTLLGPFVKQQCPFRAV